MEEATPQWSSLDPPGGVFLSGSRSLGWEKALATVAALTSLKMVLRLVPPGYFSQGGEEGVNYVLLLGIC